MFESMASFLLMEQQGARVYAGRRGGTGYARTASPYRKPYRTADGMIAALLYTDTQWRTFFRLIERPDLADDPQLQSIRGRTQRIDELYRLVEEELAKRTTAEWLEVLRSERHPLDAGEQHRGPVRRRAPRGRRVLRGRRAPQRGPARARPAAVDVLPQRRAVRAGGAVAGGAHRRRYAGAGLDDDAVRAATGRPHHPPGEPQAGPPA